MRVVVLGINYAPEIISTAVYTSGLAEALSRRGAQVEVVTAVPYYPAWRVMDGWKQRWRREERAGVRVVHCPLYVPKRPTGARRIVHHVSFAISALPIMLWSVLRRPPDLVVVVAPSLISAPVGWLAARLCRAKAWLHIQDFEVEAAFSTGLLDAESRIGGLAKAFEAWMLRRFDRVSSISAPMMQKLRDKGVSADRVYEFRNWANLDAIERFEGPSPMKAELGLETKYVALYSGNLANKQGLEIIPDIARRLAHRTDLTFAICGDGPMLETLREASRGLDNVKFFPLQPLEKLSGLLGAADLHLLPQIAGAADLVLPSKLTNMLASGRPVVATADAGTALADEVEGCGFITPPGDASMMATAIARLLDDPELRDELGRRARHRALERWDGDAILERLHAEFCKLTDKGA